MARVFVAVEATLGRRVVVKVLPPETSGVVDAERFRREVQLAARLQHPHVVPLLSAGESGGLLYYTMPYIAGETLRTRLARDGALPTPTAAGVVRDVARALAHAHRHGVVHRDIKPENILLGEDGDALVADFGIAKALAAATAGSAAALTTAGLAIGTPAYMAPEQALGDPATDHRADLYALGVVAYEALAGSHPFAGRPAQALIAAHATEAPEPLLRRRSSVPPALATLVMRLLDKHPADRPQSADEVLDALDSVATPSRASRAGGRGGSLPNDGGPFELRRRRARAGLLAAGAALLLVLAGAGAWYRYARAPGSAAARTVAVVPFENLGNAADLYFADGVTEEIASRLARVRGLTVLGRASAVGLRASGKSPQEIGRALGAAYVLRGSVRWAHAAGTGAGDVGGGTTVRIVPALVSVASGAEVWGEPYQAPLTDVFRVQAEVADRVAVALQNAIGGGASDAATGAASADRVAPAAFDAYLLGRSYWRKRGVPNLRRAAAEFRRAYTLDSSFARAWAGYADAYSLLGYADTMLTPAAARREGEPAARRAIALDPADAQGYIALASVLQNDYDFRGALAALDDAVARDPSDATAYQRRAEVLQALGRLPEAEAAGRRAIALDPLAATVTHILASVLLSERRTDEAIRLWRRAADLEPDLPLYRRRLVTAYIEAGRPAEAEAAAREVGDTSRVEREIRRGLTDPAYRRQARAALAEWRAASLDRGTPHAQLAWWYARLDMPDSALAMLRRGAEARHPGIPAGLGIAAFDGLRADPRWAELVADIRGR